MTISLRSGRRDGSRLWRVSHLMGAVLAAGCALSTVTGCGSDSGEEPVGGDGRSRRQVWEARGLRSYSYLLRVNAFSGEGAAGAVKVEVRDGVPTVIAPAGGDPLPPNVTFSRFDTIPELFALIEDAETQNAATVRVEYDPAYGFPSDAFIDYDQRLADEEVGFTVTDFLPL